MDKNRVRKTIAILLAVLFIVSMTATAVSASHPILKREFMTPGAVSGQRWGPENQNSHQITFMVKKSINNPTLYVKDPRVQSAYSAGRGQIS